MKTLIILLMIALIAVPVFAAEDAAKAAKTVTLTVKDQPVADVIKTIAADTGSTVLAEKLVKGNVTASVKDASVEDALRSVCKVLDLRWTKVYVQKDSLYAKDADALANQVRLVLGLKLPDIVIPSTSAYDPVVHLQKEATASSFISKIGTDSPLVLVYLVTNDKEYTKKAVASDAKEKMKKYSEMAKESMDLFLAMTPEERLEAMKQGVQMQMQLGPDAMKSLMETMMQMDPEYLSQTNARAMDAIMGMDPVARKNLLRATMKSQMLMMKNMSPDQMQQLQKDTMEIVKELQESGEIPGAPGGTPGQ